MTPTKVRELIPEVAKYIGIPTEDLSHMLSYYFKENKKAMSNLEHLHVTLRGLGNMTIKGWEIEKQIEKKMRSLALSRIPESAQSIEEQIEIYEKALVKWREEKLTQKHASKLKKEYYENKKLQNES